MVSFVKFSSSLNLQQLFDYRVIVALLALLVLVMLIKKAMCSKKKMWQRRRAQRRGTWKPRELYASFSSDDDDSDIEDDAAAPATDWKADFKNVQKTYRMYRDKQLTGKILPNSQGDTGAVKSAAECASWCDAWGNRCGGFTVNRDPKNKNAAQKCTLLDVTGGDPATATARKNARGKTAFLKKNAADVSSGVQVVRDNACAKGVKLHSEFDQKSISKYPAKPYLCGDHDFGSKGFKEYSSIEVPPGLKAEITYMWPGDQESQPEQRTASFTQNSNFGKNGNPGMNDAAILKMNVSATEGFQPYVEDEFAGLPVMNAPA